MAKRTLKERRAIIAGLGAAAAAGALGGRSAQAQGSSDSFTPLMHQQDAWMSALRGKHRIVMDVTSPDGLPDAIRFTGNLLAGHNSWWGVEEADVAIIVCLRHGATPFGYTDAIWSKYGKTIDPRATPLPWRTPTTRVNDPRSPISPSEACSSWCAAPPAGDSRVVSPGPAATRRPFSRRWARTWLPARVSYRQVLFRWCTRRSGGSRW